MHASVPWVSVGMVETEKLALERWSALESDPSMSHHKDRQMGLACTWRYGPSEMEIQCIRLEA